MTHSEHLRRADETYEIRHDGSGNAIHIVIKDGEAVLYPTLHDMIVHQYFGQNSERFYVSEKSVETLFERGNYNYYS